MDKTIYKREFGKRVKMRREEIGMSQDELAHKLGYAGKSFISKVESGINEIPQSKVPLLAEVLRTSVPYLMGWNRDMQDRTGLTEEERQIVAYYRSLNRTGKDIVYKTIQGIVDSGVYLEDTSLSDVG